MRRTKLVASTDSSMDSCPQRLIVVSAVNLTEAGPLSILQDSLKALQKDFGTRYRILALVHDARLVEIPGIEIREFPRAKSSWLIRLFYEYFRFRRLSLELKPYLWLSLHDITPNVVAAKRAVYCHNSAPFFRLSLNEALLEPVFWLFNVFYMNLYRINIKKNTYVIVQQDWLRRKFADIFGINNVIVAHPEIRVETHPGIRTVKAQPFRFIFPSLPRVFKNFEVVGEATRILEAQGVNGIEVIFTFSGTETRYARHIAKRFADVRALRFLGRQSRSRIFELYEQVDVLIFPSRLETWGLPLTEFKSYHKSILAADLPYAHETLGGYDKVKFFDPEDPVTLARLMGQAMVGQLQYGPPELVRPQAPFAEGWCQLFELLLREPSQG